MKIILISKQHGHTRSVTLGGWTRALLSVCLLGMPAAAGLLVYGWVSSQNGDDLFSAETRQAWEAALAEQREQVERVRQEAQTQNAALTLRVAELQARLMRLDALGEQLTTVAGMDQGEFDFSQPPALGGPELLGLDEAYTAPDLVSVIEQLSDQIENRERQLETLEALLAKRKFNEDIFIAGRPVTRGWVSSRYGRRVDPFSAQSAFHGGVDFAGKEGADVIAVASGVVTWADSRHAYGNMVEINHGNGFSTRYAHNKENLVKVGDVVKKGQVIALLGSSGRATGPHVHFEVHKNGRAVDPAAYIHRASR